MGKRLLTGRGITGEGTDMTATRQIDPLDRGASRRSAGGLAPFGYYYSYFTAGAETV